MLRKNPALEEAENAHDRLEATELASEYLSLRNTLKPIEAEISKLKAEAASKENRVAAELLEKELEKRVTELREMWPHVDENVLAELQAKKQHPVGKD